MYSSSSAASPLISVIGLSCRSNWKVKVRLFIVCLSLFACRESQSQTVTTSQLSSYKQEQSSKPAEPEAAKPEAAKPEAAKPEAAKPEAAKPEAAKPETANGESQKKIKIDNIKPDSAAATKTVAIHGSSFGKEGKVTIGGQDAVIGSWEDTEILADVPSGIPIGKTDVVVKHDDSDKTVYQGKFEVKASDYDKSAFELMTGVGASYLPSSGSGYKLDTTNNALSQTNIGQKHIELLLGGGFILPWLEKGHKPDCKKNKGQGYDTDCKKKGHSDDPDYKNFRPLETFLSIRFAPTADQTFTGFVVGGGYKIHKYFSLLIGYSLTPIDEPTLGFRRAASQVVAANPTIFPYNHYNTNDLANNKAGAFDGFPLFLYNASGVTTTRIFPTNPTVSHSRSGIFFGVGIPVNLGALLRPSSNSK